MAGNKCRHFNHKLSLIEITITSSKPPQDQL